VGWRTKTDSGRGDGITTVERDRIKALERESRQLRKANEILMKASAYFTQAELGRPFRKWSILSKSIGISVGVEPICEILQIAASQIVPSTFYAHLAVARYPDLASDCVNRDSELRPQMKQVWEDNRSVYEARKLWHACAARDMI
jgi:hypothetical protein